MKNLNILMLALNALSVGLNLGDENYSLLSVHIALAIYFYFIVATD